MKRLLASCVMGAILLCSYDVDAQSLADLRKRAAEQESIKRNRKSYCTQIDNVMAAAFEVHLRGVEPELIPIGLYPWGGKFTQELTDIGVREAKDALLKDNDGYVDSKEIVEYIDNLHWNVFNTCMESDRWGTSLKDLK